MRAPQALAVEQKAVNSLPISAYKPPPKVIVPVKKETNSRGVQTTAQSVLVFDLASNEPLYEKNSDKPVPLASLTKLMSALVLNDIIDDWQKKVSFAKEDLKGGNKPNFLAGDTLAREQFMYVGLISSDNDAIATLVRTSGIPESEFVIKMNEKAKALGMLNSSFADPTGLNPANVSTAKDLSIMVREALKVDRVQKATTMSRYQVRTLTRPHFVYNTDILLNSFLNRQPYQIIGGKTGFIEESGYNLVLGVKNQGVQLITLVLGSRTSNERFQEAKSLIAWTFENYDWPQVSVAAEQP